MADTVELLDVIKGLSPSSDGQGLAFDPKTGKLVRTDNVQVDLKQLRTDLTSTAAALNKSIADQRTFLDGVDTANRAYLDKRITDVQKFLTDADAANRSYLETLITNVQKDYIDRDTALRLYAEKLVSDVQTALIATDASLQKQITDNAKFSNDSDATNRAYLEGLINNLSKNITDGDKAVFDGLTKTIGDVQTNLLKSQGELATAAQDDLFDMVRIRAMLAEKIGFNDFRIEDHPAVFFGGEFYPIVLCYADGYAAGGMSASGNFINFHPSAAEYSELLPQVEFDGNKYVALWADRDVGNNAAYVFGGLTDDGRIVLQYPLEYPGSTSVGAGSSNGTGFPSISHVVMLGQSNNQGSQSQPVVSGQDSGFGAYKFARGVVTRLDFNNPGDPLLRPATDFVFVPLTAAVQEVFTGETPAVGLTSKLKASQYGGRFSSVPMSSVAPHFLVSYPNRGGKHLGELDFRDWEKTLASNPNPGPGSYFAHFIDDISRAKAQAEKIGASYGVSAFTFCQGENEGAGLRVPGAAVERWSVFVPAYQNDLLNAYLNWNSAALQTNPVQKRDIPMFIIQVCTQWAGESQLRLAEADPRIFLATPFYFTPSALNAVFNGTSHGAAVHHTADGQRWVGEIVGKVMRKVLMEGQDFRGLVPIRQWRVSNREVRIKFNVPVGPMVFENSFLPKARNQGFVVTLGTPDAPQAEYTISNITIEGGDTVVITLASDLPQGFDAFVTYGMQRFIDNGTIPNITGTQAGAPRNVGGTNFPTTELIFNGDLSAQIDPMLQEGCFYLRQYKTPLAEAIIRSKRVAGGKTYLLTENRDLTGTFNTTDYNSVERDRPFGNLRDSDAEMSIFNFSDASYGNRAGKMYPLWNFAAIFQKMLETA